MRSLDVVVAHSDRKSAQTLANLLHHIFRSVHVVNSADELRAAVVRNRSSLAITDLETISFKHVEQLHREFGIAVVCTHRIPDDSMWAKALSHGAIDCCHTSDVDGIVQAVTRNVLSRSHAA
jgi:DNA-binding NtrC family response regulator